MMKSADHFFASFLSTEKCSLNILDAFGVCEGMGLYHVGTHAHVLYSRTAGSFSSLCAPLNPTTLFLHPLFLFF